MLTTKPTVLLFEKSNKLVEIVKVIKHFIATTSMFMSLLSKIHPKS